jgi:CRISPR-associated exonuclease Cas4
MNVYLISALITFIGVGLFVIGIRGRAALPRGRIIFIDSEFLKNSPETLYDPETDLAGRPDYLIRNRHGTIPVEVKSSTAPPQPYNGHILQLAAYCQLVEVTTGRRPAYGIIRYRDHSFRVNYTRVLRQSLHRSLQMIRQWGTSAPNRSHQHANRCVACGFRTSCDQSLA